MALTVRGLYLPRPQEDLGNRQSSFEQENNNNDVSGRQLWVQNWAEGQGGEREQEWEDMNKEPPDEENLTDVKNIREGKLARQIDIMSFVGWLEP